MGNGEYLAITLNETPCAIMLTVVSGFLLPQDNFSEANTVVYLHGGKVKPGINSSLG